MKAKCCKAKISQPHSWDPLKLHGCLPFLARWLVLFSPFVLCGTSAHLGSLQNIWVVQVLSQLALENPVCLHFHCGIDSPNHAKPLYQHECW